MISRWPRHFLTDFVRFMRGTIWSPVRKYTGSDETRMSHKHLTKYTLRTSQNELHEYFLAHFNTLQQIIKRAAWLRIFQRERKTTPNMEENKWGFGTKTALFIEICHKLINITPLRRKILELGLQRKLQNTLVGATLWLKRCKTAH